MSNQFEKNEYLIILKKSQVETIQSNMGMALEEPYGEKIETLWEPIADGEVIFFCIINIIRISCSVITRDFGNCR
jgi:hypothetical protein